MPEFSERINAVVSAWKAKIRHDHESAPATSSPDPAGDASALRRAVADLAADLAAIGTNLAHEETRATAFETRAMDAIRKGDDRAAREALLAWQGSVDELHRLDAEATVLRAMLAECRALLDETRG
jgi:phage shock protein A